MRAIARKVLPIITLLSICIGSLGLLPAGQASAYAYQNCSAAQANFQYGRGDGCGYFFNQAVPSSSQLNVLSGGIDSSIKTTSTAHTASSPSAAAVKVVKNIRNYLNSGSTQDVTGARFIILTMTGHAGGSVAPGSVTDTSSYFNDFVARVYGEDEVGAVDYNVAENYTCGLINTLYDTAHHDDVFYRATDRSGTDPCDGHGFTAIVFYKPGTSTVLYMLKYDCGNPIGQYPIAGLPMPYDNETSTSVSSGSLLPGDIFNVNISVTTTGTALSPDFTVQSVTQNSSGTITPYGAYFSLYGLGPNPTKGPSPSTPGGVTSWGPVGYYNWASNAPTHASTSGVVTSPFQFTLQVSATTPSGTYCFASRVTPHTNLDSGYSNWDKVCVTVTNSKKPLLQVTTGDVKAGCSLYPTSTIKNNIGSKAVAVVSSSGSLISGLSSAGGTGALSLRGYQPNTLATLCSPNLAFIAGRYESEGNPIASTAPCTSGGVIDLACLSSNLIYKVNGDAIVTASSLVRGNFTLWVTGNVTVTGQVKVDPGYVTSRISQPGIGIIAGTDGAPPGSSSITFNASGGSTDQADGFYWTNGIINTCNAPSANCNSSLIVNGFLMGNNVKLQRWGTAFVNDTAETINLTGQLYLNPPLLFDQASFDDYLPNSRGEQTPLY